MPVWNLLDLGRCLNMKAETHNSAAFRSIVQVVLLSMLSMKIKRKVVKLILRPKVASLRLRGGRGVDGK